MQGKYLYNSILPYILDIVYSIRDIFKFEFLVSTLISEANRMNFSWLICNKDLMRFPLLRWVYRVHSWYGTQQGDWCWVSRRVSIVFKGAVSVWASSSHQGALVSLVLQEHLAALRRLSAVHERAAVPPRHHHQDHQQPATTTLHDAHTHAWRNSSGHAWVMRLNWYPSGHAWVMQLNWYPSDHARVMQLHWYSWRHAWVMQLHWYSWRHAWVMQLHWYSWRHARVMQLNWYLMPDESNIWGRNHNLMILMLHRWKSFFLNIFENHWLRPHFRT